MRNTIQLLDTVHILRGGKCYRAIVNEITEKLDGKTYRVNWSNLSLESQEMIIKDEEFSFVPTIIVGGNYRNP